MNKKVLAMLAITGLVFLGCESDNTGGVVGPSTSDTTQSNTSPANPYSQSSLQYYTADLNNVDNEYTLDKSGYGRGSLDINCEGGRTDWVDALGDKVLSSDIGLIIKKAQVEIEIETKTNGVEKFTIDRDDIFVKAAVIPSVNIFENTLKARVTVSPSLCEYESGLSLSVVGEVKTLDGKGVGLKLRSSETPKDSSYYTYSGTFVHGDIDGCDDAMAIFIDESDGMYLKRASIIEGTLHLEAKELFKEGSAEVSISLDDKAASSFYEEDETGLYLHYTFPKCSGNNLMSLFLEKVTLAEWEEKE